jgi:hypothetical protein
MGKSGKAEKWQARSERLAEALRENLKRRKAQARGRAVGGVADQEPAACPPEPDAKPPDFRRNRGSD